MKKIVLLFLVVGLTYSLAFGGMNYPVANDTSPNAFNYGIFKAAVNSSFQEVSAMGLQRSTYNLYSSRMMSRHATKASLNSQATFANLSAQIADFSGKCYFRNNTTFLKMGGAKFSFTVQSSSTRGVHWHGKRY